MLQKTVSFWRRMVGTHVTPALERETAVHCDDRRLWVRYSTNLLGNLHMQDRREGDKISPTYAIFRPRAQILSLIARSKLGRWSRSSCH